MHRFSSTLPVVLVLNLCAIAGNFVELPFYPDRPYPLGAWLYSANDGFGQNYGVDEDNLRTFGINVGVIYNERFLLSFDYSCLTDRNRVDSLSLRQDEIESLLGYRLLYAKSSVAAFSLFGGAGGIFYGNFGSLGVQEGAHDIGHGLTRPVPQNYDRSSAHALAFLYSELYLSRTALNVSLYGHLTHLLDWNSTVAVGYWALKPMIQIKFRLAWEFDRVAAAGSAAKNIYDSECGPWFSSKVMVGPVVIERGFNLDKLTQFSYVGFRFNGIEPISDQGTGYRISYSLGWPIGHNSWIESFRLHPMIAIPRMSFFLRTYYTENAFFNNKTMLESDRRLRRINETSIGSEWYVGNPDEYHLINGFVFSGAGFSREMVSTYTAYQSKFLETYTTPIVIAGAGVRVDVPDLLFRKKGRYLGAEMTVNVRYGYKDTGIYTNPDMLLSWGLVFSER